MVEQFDAQEIKRLLPFLDLMARDQVPVRRDGPLFVARCPFHDERSGSFTIYPEHAHCYGCGWNGDIFDYWCAKHGGVFRDAVAALAALVSLSPAPVPVKIVSRLTRRADEPREKPALPRMRALEPAEVRKLAELRGLSCEGIAAAAADTRVGFCEWPQFLDRDGAWRAAHDSAPAWVVTDRAVRVAQFRRLDGDQFTRKDGKTIKAWTKGSPTWPVGAAAMGNRTAVLLVEGGADMLAAYHFLVLFRRLHAVAVVAMLGASCSICDEALRFFKGKRVRMMMHVDAANERTGLIPSFEAAARWTDQLTAVGAAAESFSLADLPPQRDGKPTEDLNDLARCDEAAWLDPELKAAFFDFDF